MENTPFGTSLKRLVDEYFAAESIDVRVSVIEEADRLDIVVHIAGPSIEAADLSVPRSYDPDVDPATKDKLTAWLRSKARAAGPR